MHASVTLENVTISYRRHPAVHHISGGFLPGALTAVTGPNGAGKSTLLKAIAGILTPDEGRVRIENALPNAIAYLPQAADLQRDFPLTVLHLVATGTWPRTGVAAKIDQHLRAEASRALNEVGLSGSERLPLSRLSSGQLQRALFARLLVQNASLILLDEPFTAMDAATTEHLLALLHRWKQEGRTVIAVLHDAGQIQRHFDECLLLARECIAWGPPETALNEASLKRALFLGRPVDPSSFCLQAG